MKWFCLLVLGWVYGPATGQDLIFCLDHNREGEALAPGLVFELDQFGQEVDFLVRDAEGLEAGKYYFFVDKKVDQGFLEEDTKSLLTDSARTWMALSYRFDRSGTYRVSVRNADKEELCQADLRVNVLRDVGGPSYYRDANMIFCYQVQDGEPDVELQRSTLSTSKRRPIKVLLKHYRALRTNEIIVDVWREGEELKYVESIRFEVEPHWKFTQFDYQFRSGGTYIFRAYSENDIWIASAKIRIEQ